MIEGASPWAQALLGTCFTWFLTALGASVVFLIKDRKGLSVANQATLLCVSLGFASGVMLSASYWSLLAPSVELAKGNEFWGTNAALTLVPVCGGFFLGALFVYLSDIWLEKMGVVGGNSANPGVALAVATEKLSSGSERHGSNCDNNTSTYDSNVSIPSSSEMPQYYYQNGTTHIGLEGGERGDSENDRKWSAAGDCVHLPFTPSQWKRILLLIVAITVHNIPEGMAVGVGFAAIGRSPLATFESARSLAWGIGLQNFPEGLAVSLPLMASGFSVWKAFWFGQLSGMVEPVAGLVGALAVSVFEPVLCWSLSFAAGAMVYVVISDIVPEAHHHQTTAHKSGSLTAWSSMFGFILMMALDVGLG